MSGADGMGAADGPLAPVPILVRRTERAITAVGRAASVLILLLMAVIVFDVATRGAAWTNSTKLQEAEWHLHTALVFLSLGYALVRDRHVRIEVLREGWAQRRRAAVDAAGVVLLLIPVSAVAIWHGADFVAGSYATGESSPSMTGLGHRWAIKATMPVGLTLVLVAGLCLLWRCAAVLRRGR